MFLKNLARISLFVIATAAVCAAAGPLRYELGFDRPNTHLLNVTIHADELNGKSVEFALPAWAPGVYIVEEFAANVQGFSASNPAGSPLAWRKTGGQTWQVDLAGATSAIIHYQIYANGMPIRGAQYDGRHASLTGAAVWMYQVDGKARPVELAIQRNPLPLHWKVATGLTKAAGDKYTAPDYDWFADCPIEISAFNEKTFTALGTTYHVVVDDQLSRQDFSRFTNDLQKVIEKGIVPILAPAVGGPLPAPFSEYWFLIHLTPGFGGLCAGVEHLNSTMIVMASDWDDNRPTDHNFLTDLYSTKIDLAAHEFFHAWNVKRLRPLPLGPFDYSRPVYTRSLWISEGLTNYFTAVGLLRSGFWTPQNYLDYIGRVISGLEREPGRRERSLEETSWDTWFGFPGGGGVGLGTGFASNLVNTNYSYYDGGQVLGVLLDLEIRHATGNRKSLDDWMRLMYQRYALPKPGFEPEDAVRAASEVAGKDMSDFFRRYVSGREALPYEDEFGYAGMQVRKTYSNQPWLGATVRADAQGRVMISNTLPGGPAESAGLDRGDVIVAIDGKAAESRTFEKQLAAQRIGGRLMFTVIRYGEVWQIPVKLVADPYPAFTLKPMENADKLQMEIYRSITGIQ